jgi:hypothetical protein
MVYSWEETKFPVASSCSIVYRIVLPSGLKFGTSNQAFAGAVSNTVYPEPLADVTMIRLVPEHEVWEYETSTTWVPSGDNRG